MGSVVFSDAFTQSYIGYGSYDLKLDFSEDYNSANNKTTVKITGISIRKNDNSAVYGDMPVYGSIKVGGTTLVTVNGSPAYANMSGTTYRPVTGWSSSSVAIQHGSDGNATVKFDVIAGNTGNGCTLFGAFLTRAAFGVRTASKNVSLTRHTTNLTVSPNGGVWNDSIASQSFAQAPTSTMAVGNPTRDGYTFDGWTHSGGGSFSSGVYTFGSSSGSLTASWTPIDYTVTCEDRVGDENGALLGSGTITRHYGEVISGSAWGNLPTYDQYYNGFFYTSSTTETVTEDTTVYRFFSTDEFELSVNKSDNGITVNISRTASPNAKANIGLLSNGAKIYYGDTLSISWAIASGYMADTLTIDGEDVSAETPPQTVTVNDDVTVVMLIKLGAIVYIENVAHQAFIWNGSSWEQYEAHIYNGSSWDAY